MDEADVRLLTGDQGGGKTGTAVALVVDDTYMNIDGIRSPDGQFYKARALNESEIKKLESHGINYNILKHICVHSPNNGQYKIIEKPKGYVVSSPVRIFSNFHFFGIYFKYVDLPFIIEHINDDLIMDGWIVLDESIMTEKRDTMSSVGKMMAWFGAQARRRRLKMVIIAQYADMVQSRFNLFATTKAICTYDKKTNNISLEVNRNSPVMKSTTYYAPDYWRFYKHDERVLVPQYRIDKTLAGIYNTGLANV